MIQKYKQSGFYLTETLISLQIFFISLLTLLPIQHQLLLEKQTLQEKDKVIYFLADKMNQAVIHPPEKQIYIFEEVIQSPVTITYTTTDSLLKGCVNWVNAKNDKDKLCLFVKEESTGVFPD